MREAPRGRLDRAIDRAVRDLLRAEPPANLRQRVLERLEPQARRSIWQMPAFAAAAAVLVVILGVALFLRPGAPTPAPSVPIADATPRPAPTPIAAAPSPAVPVEQVSATPPPRRAPAARRSEDIFGRPSGLVRAADLGGAAPPAAIEGAAPHADTGYAGAFDLPVRPDPIAPIVVEPIRIDPIAVSPVTISALPGRN